MTGMEDYFAAEPARRLLHAWMATSGLTQAETAVALGLPLRTLSRVLSPLPRLRWDTADRVAIALGTHPSQLWPNWFETNHERQPRREAS